jgi:hypothetical protein
MHAQLSAPLQGVGVVSQSSCGANWLYAVGLGGRERVLLLLLTCSAVGYICQQACCATVTKAWNA